MTSKNIEHTADKHISCRYGKRNHIFLACNSNSLRTDKTELAKGDIDAFIVGNEMYIQAWFPDELHNLNPKYVSLRFTEPVYINRKDYRQSRP